MAGKIKIEISESELELLEELKKQENQELKERIQALYWIKTHQVESTGKIACLIGKHRTTVSRWLSKYRREGLKGLLTEGKSTGRTSKIPQEVEERLKQELQKEGGFSSYKEVQMWLKSVAGIEMSYGRVHHVVHYKLKAKLKVPHPVHIKKEPGAVEELKKTEKLDRTEANPGETKSQQL